MSRTQAGLPVIVDRIWTLLGVIVPFIAVIIAAIMTWNRLTTWGDLAICAGMYFPTALGLTVGFHRMLAHRAFEAHRVVRFILLALGCMAGTGDPIRWSAIHLEHHARADREGDPHSPLNGLWHAHIGWFLPGFNDKPETYARSVAEDPMCQFFRRTYWIWILISVSTPFFIGGWTGLLWGTFVRFFFTLHIGSSVNSICHTFGRADYETGDRSRNEWVFGVFALGEGWHNNHHAFPRSAFHGLKWWQIDVSGYLIRTLEWLRLARNVHRVTPQLLDSRRTT